MRIPTVRGLIDRRVLVNFRVEPQPLSELLPSPFRPQLVRGFGIAGICLIRLKQIRPRALPAFIGISSENAAHRIAVEWDANGETHTGVFIPRRDTSSLLNALAGGRLFPRVPPRAPFDVREVDDHVSILMRSRDDSARLVVEGNVTPTLPTDSIFSSLAEASRFFERGSLGYSPGHARGQFDGLELKCSNWQVEALDVARVASSFFDDRRVFPAGCVHFDHALLMRNIVHQWRSCQALCCAEPRDSFSAEPKKATASALLPAPSAGR